MSKWFIGLLVVYSLTLLITIAVGMPVALWQWILLAGIVSSCVRSWRVKAAHQEKMDAIYGRYNRPSDGKSTQYHGL